MEGHRAKQQVEATTLVKTHPGSDLYPLEIDRVPHVPGALPRSRLAVVGPQGARQPPGSPQA